MNTERGTERVNFNGSVEFSDAILWSPPGDLFRLPNELYLTLTLKVIYPAKIYSAGPFVFTKRPASHSRNFKHLHPGSTNDTTGLLLMNSWEAHIVYAVVGKGVFIDFFDLILVCACFHTIQCALLIALTYTSSFWVEENSLVMVTPQNFQLETFKDILSCLCSCSGNAASQCVYMVLNWL